jgi:cytochrome c biogenesis protein CcmG, thiol:disulfide interchange protein DsbE
MRIRLVMLALCALAVGACAQPSDGIGDVGTAAPATTAAAVTAAAPAAIARTKSPVRYPPPGLTPAARRKPAPALQVTAFDGRTVTLDGLRGRPVVVSFFESWCGVCQVEQPDLTKVAAEFAGRAGFVGISYHDTVAAGRAYQRRFHISYPLANDSSGKTWASWGVPYQPVVVLVDNQGRVAERFDGGTTGGTLRAALTYLTSE